MKGGSKYMLRFEIYHTVHNEFSSDMDSFAKLKWESDMFPQTIIPKASLFKVRKPPLLKIT